MNKFIQSTKQFFNKKPVRIVTALLVIADYYGQVAQSKSDCSEAPCDLHNTTVDIQSYTCSDPSTTRQKQIQKVKNINTCDLVKNHGGCQDLDGELNTWGVRDSGFCTLGALKAPAGIEIQTYAPPSMVY